MGRITIDSNDRNTEMAAMHAEASCFCSTINLDFALQR